MLCHWLSTPLGTISLWRFAKACLSHRKICLYILWVERNQCVFSPAPSNMVPLGKKKASSLNESHRMLVVGSAPRHHPLGLRRSVVVKFLGVETRLAIRLTKPDTGADLPRFETASPFRFVSFRFVSESCRNLRSTHNDGRS